MAGVHWARKRPALRARWIEDDEVLTQYGQEGPDGSCFRGQPRFNDGEVELSMIVGKLTPKQALSLIASHRLACPMDAVRYFRVADLREREYVVRHTPSRNNPDHVSVTAPDGCSPQVWWSSQGEPILELLVLDGVHVHEGDE